MGCGGSTVADTGPFYERTVRCVVPAFWEDVSDEAKVDHIFTMIVTPRMHEAAARSAALSNNQTALLHALHTTYNSFIVPGGFIMQTNAPNSHDPKCSFIEPKREGARRMSVTEYFCHSPLLSDPAAIKASSNMWYVTRVLEASVTSDSGVVEVKFTIDNIKKPPQVPGMVWSIITRVVKPYIDRSVEAVEREFLPGASLPMSITVANVQVLPVATVDLPIAQAVAFVAEAQVVQAPVMQVVQAPILNGLS